MLALAVMPVVFVLGTDFSVTAAKTAKSFDMLEYA